MKKIIILLLITATLSLLGQEKPETISSVRLKLAAEMIENNGNLAQMRGYRDQRITQYDMMIKQRLANITERSVAKKMAATMEKIIQKELDWTSFRDSVINVYANNFNEAELKAIVAFYKSPAGRKIIKQNDIINNSLNRLFRERCEATDKQIREYLDKNKPATAAQSVQLRPLGKTSATPTKVK